jgi:predicted nuclease with RNAse H fold
VDVGGKRKGFDVAVIDERRLLALVGSLGLDAVVELVDAERPAVVAIDSPRSCASTGRTARDCERAVATTICGIRWTPDRPTLTANPYYAWIVEGLELFEALSDRSSEVIEVFPTASWTRWFGPRGSQSRATWTGQGVARLGLGGIPARTNQDERDAIAAAVTARQHSEGKTEGLGEIVVPVSLLTGDALAAKPPSPESRITPHAKTRRRRPAPSISSERRRSSTQSRQAGGPHIKTSPRQGATRTRRRPSVIGCGETATVSPTSIGFSALTGSWLTGTAQPGPVFQGCRRRTRHSSARGRGHRHLWTSQ